MKNTFPVHKWTAAFLLLATAQLMLWHVDGVDHSFLRGSAATTRLNASTIPKYVTDLVIPPVIYDDHGEDSNFEIALRQFTQQMLPEGYPSTPIWGYGIPSNPNSYHHPSGTVEVTRNRKTTITWRNELLMDAVACRSKGYSSSNPGCAFSPHLIQDVNGVPIIDQSLHWAAPNQICANGKNRTDCVGGTLAAYTGPVPIVVHVHGSHVEALSDGYPEAWWLPKATNIPKGYATGGTMFQSRSLPASSMPDDDDNYIENVSQGDSNFKKATNAARGQGYAVFRYTNDQDTTTLWYHDHTLGITRLNVYAAGAGFWLIRNKHDKENLLAAYDATGKAQTLPGPPAKLGQDPNGNLTVRKEIREIPLAFQDKSFYSDGRLFYPSNRVFFDYPYCDDGSNFAADVINIPYKPKSDVSPIWNPEAFFDTMLVNGNTYPKFNVAPERYRFRMLNACDSRTLNLAFKISSTTGTDLPFFVIGSDQGLLPQVVKIQTGYATKIQPGHPLLTETPLYSPLAALLMSPGERYDTIVDFAGLPDKTEVFLINTGPDFPFADFLEEYEPPDPATTGQVMKFVIDYSLKKSTGDTSTSPYYLVTSATALSGSAVFKASKVRDLALYEMDSTVCAGPPDPLTPCTIPIVNCSSGVTDPLTGVSSLTYGPIQTSLGYNGRLGPGKITGQRWDDPINQNPKFGATEVWEIWNWTPDGHPMHLHLVAFNIVGRFDMQGNLLGGPLPYETGMKDTVVALPGQVTKVIMTFDISGLYVWHCHILSHEDNEMMVPYCVGEKGRDCPARLF